MSTSTSSTGQTTPDVTADLTEAEDRRMAGFHIVMLIMTLAVCALFVGFALHLSHTTQQSSDRIEQIESTLAAEYGAAIPEGAGESLKDGKTVTVTIDGKPIAISLVDPDVNDLDEKPVFITGSPLTSEGVD